MSVRYFADTDTLLLELLNVAVVETRDLDEDTVIDLDAQGSLCAITIAHASKRADAPHFSYEQVAG